MKLRLMAAAMLFHGDELLMMKRPITRTLSPGMWAVVGGHLEQEEIADPRAACLREIHEECGMTESQLEDFKLQYVLLRLYGDEIRQQFIYTGRTTTKEVTDCDEGELFWIPKEEALDRDMSYIFRCTLEHFLQNGPSEHLWLGSSQMTSEGAAHVRWAPLSDYGIL